jgi:hypothetical protein
MAALPTDTRLLAIYLNDHHSLLSAQLDRAGHVADTDGHRPGGACLRDLRDEFAEDLEALRQIMRALGLEIRETKAVLARAAERLGRFKPNGHLLTRSPLGRVVDLDALRTGVQGKLALWQVLHTLADTDSRLDREVLDGLLRRAELQITAVERLRIAAAVDTFGGADERAAHPEPLRS